MMAPSAPIYAAFTAAVQAYADAQSPPLPVLYPGTGGDAPASGQWLEVRVFWNGAENYGWSDDGPFVSQGFFRIGLATRPPVNMNDFQAEADELAAAFPKGSTWGAARMEGPPQLGGPVTVDERIVIPVTLDWRTVGD